MKRIRIEGKSASKYDIAFFLDRNHYRFLPWVVMYDAFSYDDMVGFYYSFLSGK